MKLVEADESIAARNSARKLRQRILLASERAELFVHAFHEGVEMHPSLAPQRDRGRERVHEEALAPPDAPPQVHPARRDRRIEPSPQQRAARSDERDELVVKSLKPVE